MWARLAAINRTLERCGSPGAFLVDLIPSLKYLPSIVAPFKAEAEKLHKFEYGYFNGLVKEAGERQRTQSQARRGRGAWISQYFDKISVWGLSEFQISYTLGTVYEGGSGTTSATMMSFCLAMWHYPDWQDRSQRDIDEVVGPDRVPNFDDMPRLPLVRACMSETLRWRPVTPGVIPHKCTKDDVFDGYFIPNGTVVHANIWGMFKDKATFPDPETFNPDRWLKPQYPTYKEPLTENPNLKRYTAFGFGRRICPGLLVAESSLFIEMATLMWSCNVVKKLDGDGRTIPVPWYSYQPGSNTRPRPFDFGVELRDVKKLHLLRESAALQTPVASEK